MPSAVKLMTLVVNGSLQERLRKELEEEIRSIQAEEPAHGSEVSRQVGQVVYLRVRTAQDIEKAAGSVVAGRVVIVEVDVGGLGTKSLGALASRLREQCDKANCDIRWLVGPSIFVVVPAPVEFLVI